MQTDFFLKKDVHTSFKTEWTQPMYLAAYDYLIKVLMCGPILNILCMSWVNSMYNSYIKAHTTCTAQNRVLHWENLSFSYKRKRGLITQKFK